MVSSWAPKIACLLGAGRLHFTYCVCGQLRCPPFLGFFLKEISAIVRAICRKVRASPLCLQGAQNLRPCLGRGRSNFAPEPASRTRPRRTHPTLTSVLPLFT
ncbi:hypothetical protein F5Y12DRAFT_760413 [Xylaria sp. FL1777]|nr:hypothetical protein F5Y12DRAFT_760413 [Xylaria sp. FL1777]